FSLDDLAEDPTISALSTLVDDGLKSAEEKVLHWKSVGNDHFAESRIYPQRLKDAIDAYKRGLQVFVETDLDKPELASVLLRNMAMCQMRLKKFVEAVDSCRLAIEKNKANGKAYFSAARSSQELGLYKQGIDFCAAGIKEEAVTMESKEALENLKREMETAYD